MVIIRDFRHTSGKSLFFSALEYIERVKRCARSFTLARPPNAGAIGGLVPTVLTPCVAVASKGAFLRLRRF
jgi:hypothetical protein